MTGPPTKVQNTTRPDTIWPEEWPRRSKKPPQQEEIAAWDEAKTGFQEARRRRRNFDVPSEDTEYLKVISEARATVRGSFNCRVFPNRNAGGKPDAMPIFKCFGKTEAVNVSKSTGIEEKSNTQDHISEQDTCLTVWCKSPSRVKGPMNFLEVKYVVHQKWDK